MLICYIFWELYNINGHLATFLFAQSLTLWISKVSVTSSFKLAVAQGFLKGSDNLFFYVTKKHSMILYQTAWFFSLKLDKMFYLLKQTLIFHFRVRLIFEYPTWTLAKISVGASREASMATTKTVIIWKTINCFLLLSNWWLYISMMRVVEFLSCAGNV